MSKGHLLEAFCVLGSVADLDVVRMACHAVLLRSTLFHASSPAFSDSDAHAISTGVFRCLTDPDDHPSPDIILETRHPLLGRAIEVGEFASMFSEDFMYENCSFHFDGLGLDTIRGRLHAALASLLFRYRTCHSADEVFPISKVLEYVKATRSLFLDGGDSWNECRMRVMQATLLALRSLEISAEEVERSVERYSPHDRQRWPYMEGS